MDSSRTWRLLAAVLSTTLALGLVVDIVDEYATEAPAMATLAERPPITSPQLDGKLFVLDSSVAAATASEANTSQPAQEPANPAPQPAPAAAN